MILVAWYGSFPSSGTIGDLLALRSVVSYLAARGSDVAHASAHDVEVPGSRRVQLDRVLPGDVDALIFVCGPIINGHPDTQALFDRFAPVWKMGVAVSLFPHGHRNRCNPFDVVLAREGGDAVFEDVALVAPGDPMVRAPATGQFTIGVVLRGPQAEYEPKRCLSQRTAEIAGEAAVQIAARRHGRVITIENHLDRSGLSAAAIEASYAQCDLVLTSRYHGAMLALRHDVPFVAIDQIEDGAKVSALLGPTGWPHVYLADGTDPSVIVLAGEDALTDSMRRDLAAVKRAAEQRARATLVRMETELLAANGRL